MTTPKKIQGGAKRCPHRASRNLHTPLSLQGLTQEELDRIPGSNIVSNIDNLALEICVRNGTSIDIHPDECKYWIAQDADMVKQFKALKEHHDGNFKNMLSAIIEKQTTSSLPVPSPQANAADEMLVEMVDEEKPQEEVFHKEELGTLQELEETHGPFVGRCMSEEGDVELIRDKNLDEWIVSKKGRSLTRGCQLGGYGTGKWVSIDAPGEGPPLRWDDGDKTMMQAGLR
jgi:hypothetical protein